MTGIPPFAAFPSLPATFGRYLGERATTLNVVSRKVCDPRPQATWIGSPDGFPQPDFFASDRFHPSVAGYGLWAQHVADHLTS